MKVDIFNTENKYKVLYVDPPWRQAKGGKKRARPNTSGCNLDYQTLSLEDIKEHLKVGANLLEQDGILFLWTIDKYLFEAEEIAKSLGFKLHARMIWNKITGIPAAFTIRYGHEYLLYMYKGKFTPVVKDYRGLYHSVFVEKSTRHSKKPIIAYEIIENLYPEVKRLEMYARYARDGWDFWGNEV